MNLFSRFSPEKIARNFPSIKNYVYLDSACMSLKPLQVIDAMNNYYDNFPACAGRSSHSMSEKVNNEIQKSREIVRKFIGAGKSEEIIFTRNTTESINLVASGINWKPQDEVLITDKEHNSNLLPWVRLAKESKIKLVVCTTEQDGTISLDKFRKCLNNKTKLAAFNHVSNLDGVENPLTEMIELCKNNKTLTLVDAAQSAGHIELNVKKLQTDFLAFSGHKILGPTGTGILYGKKQLLETIRPLNIGGGTVTNSTSEDYELEKLPERLEAGLQDYAGIIGLGEACKYLSSLGLKNIHEHTIKLNNILTKVLSSEEKIKILGPSEAKERGSICSFVIKNADSLNVARLLSSKGIYVRAGMHCVHNWFNKNKIKGAIRASFQAYNTEEDVSKLAKAIREIIPIVT